MLRMSRITDYGIVLLTQLATEASDPGVPEDGPADPREASPPEAIHNARELAARAGLPLPVVSKILKALTREGFLVSQRGARGGYALARRPEDISVASIIDALEGPIALTECGTELHGACERESRCAVRQPWQQINREVRKTLERVRLSDLAAPGPRFDAPGGGLSLLLNESLPVSPRSAVPATD
jgi:FeS assembly SUF system regulator